jgi:DNA-binding transcriptional MerR regulator
VTMLRHQDKSPEAFRTISEVSAELDLPQHILRFWESKFRAIKPIKRAGGRRYYRPDDLELLRGIRSLLCRDGLTIRDVQKIFREQGARYVACLGGARLSLVRSHLSPAHEFAALARKHAPLAGTERTRVQELMTELLAIKAELGAVRARAAAALETATNAGSLQ